jgi:hypothetical protein
MGTRSSCRVTPKRKDKTRRVCSCAVPRLAKERAAKFTCHRPIAKEIGASTLPLWNLPPSSEFIGEHFICRQRLFFLVLDCVEKEDKLRLCRLSMAMSLQENGPARNGSALLTCWRRSTQHIEFKA